MEASRRQDSKGRASRSRKDASNKENICPLEAGLFVAEMDSRRSPLPVGFPRSPLQDITHIICPPNIWSDVEDPLTVQVHKKCKKENSADFSAENEDAGTSSSWKGLRSCAQFRFQTQENQAEGVTSENVEPVQSLSSLMERGVETSKTEFPLGIYRDAPANSGSSAPVTERKAIHCEGQDKCGEEGRVESDVCSYEHAEMGVAPKAVQKDGEGVENERRRTEARSLSLEWVENRRAGNILPVQCMESCKAGDSEESYKDEKARHKPMLVAEEENCTRPGQSGQAKKRSTLSMLR